MSGPHPGPVRTAATAGLDATGIDLSADALATAALLATCTGI